MVRVGHEQHVIKLHQHSFTIFRIRNHGCINQFNPERPGSFHPLLLQSRCSKWSWHSTGRYRELYDASAATPGTGADLPGKRCGESTDIPDIELERLDRGNVVPRASFDKLDLQPALPRRCHTHDNLPGSERFGKRHTILLACECVEHRRHKRIFNRMGLHDSGVSSGTTHGNHQCSLFGSLELCGVEWKR